MTGKSLTNDDHPAAPAVAWRDVGMVYPNGHVALGGVSLDVPRGQTLALLGASGSGKTTLLKMVNRLLDPTSGEVIVSGKPTRDWNPITLRRSTGYVIQEVGLMPHLTVLANVALVPRLQGRPKETREENARNYLTMVGLDPERFGPLRPHQLSGGQRQRVGVARALCGESDLILMDEPFGALDPITRRELQDEFRKLQRRLGKTVVVVTHDIREACRIGDRLAVIDRGKLVQQGTPGDLAQTPANAFVRDFFRDAEAVVIEGEDGAP